MATMITPFRAAFQLLLKYPQQSSPKRGTFDLGHSLWVRHQSNVLATRLDAFATDSWASLASAAVTPFRRSARASRSYGKYQNPKLSATVAGRSLIPG